MEPSAADRLLEDVRAVVTSMTRSLRAEFVNSLLKEQGQTDMFATFNGLPEDANYKPYEYSGHWTNRLIRATAQRAMASLLYKDAMRGKVNLIYIDPPYNISFRSNFQANAQSPGERRGLGQPAR